MYYIIILFIIIYCNYLLPKSLIIASRFNLLYYTERSVLCTDISEPRDWYGFATRAKTPS